MIMARIHQFADLLASILLLTTLASAQAYRVAGVISSTEGHPLSRARVTLSDSRTGRPLATMLTADDGHFEFLSIPRKISPHWRQARLSHRRL